MTQKNQVSSFDQLKKSMPQKGKVEWIGLRTATRGSIKSVDRTTSAPGSGLEGDRFNSKNNKREVTLIQGEHLDVVASILAMATVDPALVRRNIVVRGLNLLALKDQQFKVGETLLEYTGLCHPCSRMEANLGQGGYNAMRGHGGITAKIIEGGEVKVGDMVSLVDQVY